jgi:hypothetical protein
MYFEFYLQEIEFGFAHGQLGVVGLHIFSWEILEANIPEILLLSSA